MVREPVSWEEFEGLSEFQACNDSLLTEERVTICLTATPKAVDRATSSNRYRNSVEIAANRLDVP
jgi:hypothetical protein